MEGNGQTLRVAWVVGPCALLAPALVFSWRAKQATWTATRLSRCARFASTRRTAFAVRARAKASREPFESLPAALLVDRKPTQIPSKVS